jgi:hypothetical protein
MIDIVEYAAWVHKLANTEHFERLLAAFQREAIEQGFGFVEGSEHCVMCPDEERLLGAVVLRARLEDLWPFYSRREADRYVSTRIEDGEAQTWTASILSALGKRGVVIARIHPPYPKDPPAKPRDFDSMEELFIGYGLTLRQNEGEPAAERVYSGSQCAASSTGGAVLRA